MIFDQIVYFLFIDKILAFSGPLSKVKREKQRDGHTISSHLPSHLPSHPNNNISSTISLK